MSTVKNSRIILDKNAIQGLNSEELEEFKLNYRTLITQGLQIECLGDLAKKCPKYEKMLKKMNSRQGISKEGFTASLFKKIMKFPLATHNQMDLVKKELFENVHIKTINNFFDYVNYIPPSTSIDIFEHLDSTKQVKSWAKEEFTGQDNELSMIL